MIRHHEYKPTNYELFSDFLSFTLDDIISAISFAINKVANLFYN